MRTKWEIILAGSGGQGLGLSGKIFAEASILETKCFAAHNQSFGGQARGGPSQSTLIISCEEILYPIVTAADLLVALTPDAYMEYEPKVTESGVIIYDSSREMELRNRVKEYGFPFKTESLKLDNTKGITLMAIGAANKLLKIVTPEFFLKALGTNFKGKALDLNIAAFNKGQALAAETETQI